MRILRCLAIAYMAVTGLDSMAHAEPVGGYAAKRPDGCKPLPETIYVSERFQGAAPTNQWFSSLVWEKHSQNMFPHPMGAVFCDSGLAIAYPGAALVSGADAIMGGGVSSHGDIVIGHSEIESADATRLDSNSEWFITGVQK
ncbi:MAG: hypothetical protein GY880_08000, partial [Planctomycetaceae bacterium]|nr:hypothetical protein [Planctomycetaceae bacterium]